MAQEKQEDKEPPKSLKEKADELKKQIGKKEQKDTESIIKQIATRDKLERDYNEDIIDVVFGSASGISRKIKSKKPTPKQMSQILRLSAESIICAEKNDPQSIIKSADIIDKFCEIASELTIDKKLDVDFWSEKVGNDALNNFISKLIYIIQNPAGLKGDELKSFRG